MFTLASTIQDRYPDWNTSGLAVTLYDYEAQCSLTLAHNSLSYVREMKKEKAKGGDDARIQAILEHIGPKLQKKSYERVGLRCLFLSPVEMNFEMLTSLISEKFLVQNKEITESICPDLIDLAYTVIFVDNGLRVHLRAGPLKRDEIEIHFQPDRNNLPPATRGLPADKLYSDYPDVSLFMDIDVSKKDVKEGELSQFYVDAQGIQLKLSQNMLRYIFGMKD
jgi:hypothetical protein